MTTPPPFPSRIFGSWEVSPCGKFRYELTRSWDRTRPTIAFVMLNPSTADAADDDPTIRKCIGFGNRWGYGELRVYNLWAYRATDPANVPSTSGWEEEYRNIEYLKKATASSSIVCAWGSTHIGKIDPIKRAQAFQLNIWAERSFFALAVNQDGNPRHPLYVRNDQPLIPYSIPREPRP